MQTVYLIPKDTPGNNFDIVVGHDGSLLGPVTGEFGNRVVEWSPGEPEIMLEGPFNLVELDAIIAHVKKCGSPS